jgi:hypothetical protein
MRQKMLNAPIGSTASSCTSPIRTGHRPVDRADALAPEETPRYAEEKAIDPNWLETLEEGDA